MFRFVLTQRWIVGCIRFWLGFILLSAGVTKMLQGNFIQLIGPPWLIEVLAKHQLGLFAEFIAISQIIIGFCLLVKRFATLGAVMAIPMFLNILMVTISQDWRGTPYVVGFFLVCNVYLLVWDFDKLKFLLIDQEEAVPKGRIVRKDLQIDLLYLIGLVPVLLAVLMALPLRASQILAFGGLVCWVGVYVWQLIKKQKNIHK